MKRIIASLAITALALSAAAARADNIYVTITGSKQGKFRGELRQKGMEDKFAGVKFRYEVSSPIDLATGQATGRRQHKPVIITKEWGAASPQLFTALVSNEILKDVMIDFVGVGPDGRSILSHTIKLSNAKVLDIADSTEPATAAGAGALRHMQDVSFSFQTIELQDLAGKTMGGDSLMPR